MIAFFVMLYNHELNNNNKEYQLKLQESKINEWLKNVLFFLYLFKIIYNL